MACWVTYYCILLSRSSTYISDNERMALFTGMLQRKNLTLVLDNAYSTEPLLGRVYTRVSRITEYGPSEWFMTIYGVKKLFREAAVGQAKVYSARKLDEYAALLSQRINESEEPLPYRLDYFSTDEWSTILYS